MIKNVTTLTPDEHIAIFCKGSKLRILYFVLGVICMIFGVLFALVDYQPEDLYLIILMLVISLMMFAFGLFFYSVLLFITKKVWDKQIATYEFFENSLALSVTVFKKGKEKVSNATILYSKLKKYREYDGYHVVNFSIMRVIIKSDGFETVEDLDNFVSLAKDKMK